jgi:hypothetical protein
MTKINFWLIKTKINSFCELEEDLTKLRKFVLSLLISDQNRKYPKSLNFILDRLEGVKKHLTLLSLYVLVFWMLYGEGGAKNEQ